MNPTPLRHCSIEEDKSCPNPMLDTQESVLNSTFYLDHVGSVILTYNSDGLSWKLVPSLDNDELICLWSKHALIVATEIKFSDAYAVEVISWDLSHESNSSNPRGCLLGHESEMHHFTVHAFQSSKSQPSRWVPAVYTFGHKDQQTCELWVNRINASLDSHQGRPKNLLVFVNPRSGKENGCKTWETVAPLFSRAKIKTKVIVTQRASHAFDVMASTANKELKGYDGVVAVGGDGFFNEILNGFLLSRHTAPHPPTPLDVSLSNASKSSYTNEAVAENEINDQSTLLSNEKDAGSRPSKSAVNSSVNSEDQDLGFSIPDESFRFGIIPAGSTDAIVMCTTGFRDPMMSALQIILGKRVRLDIAQVVRWKINSTSKLEPYVRYAASFAGYGFYGDVIRESEKYRWMGPKRYDYAGTKVFLKHSSYEAEVAYLDVKSEEPNSNPEKTHVVNPIRPFWSSNKSERALCRANCSVCKIKSTHINSRSSPYSRPEEGEGRRWLKSKGRFLSIGAAVISCRNEKAPDGLVADAHLSDGFLHLILIRDCPHALYLWHLTQLTRKGGNPMNFKFVEHHKTTAFTFTSFGKESMWNLDGELLQAHQLSAQVFRGLITLFASGPEV